MALATSAAYLNSFRGAFVFDDKFAIPENPSIRQLWHIRKVLSPPGHGETVSGRPLVNLSLAVNYALGRNNVWGYHAFNLAVHILAALALLGILRRTLETVSNGRWKLEGGGREEDGAGNGGAESEISAAAVLPSPLAVYRRPSIFLAFAITLLWALHPLQTESVTYIVQRAESMAGLFCLLTLYCVIRAASSRAVPWHVAAVLACLLGMATKEVTAVIPLLVLLYDRTFLAGSFAGALRRRRGLYLALAATWIPLACLAVTMGIPARAGDLRASSPWSYGVTQPGVILHYLRLVIWPSPLCLHYGWPIAATPSRIVPAAIAVGLLLGATVYAVIRRRAWGFCGAWFFLTLAPTSSIIPLADPAFEHRMYLPLAAVLTILALGAAALGRWLVARKLTPLPVVQWSAAGLVAAAGLLLGTLTYARNADYRSDFSIWTDTVAKSPADERAQLGLGAAWLARGQTDAAMRCFRKALELNPQFAQAHYNLATVLENQGEMAEAIAHFRKALEIDPRYAVVCDNLGAALIQQGQLAEGIALCRKALEICPEMAAAHNNLGLALELQGDLTEALPHYRAALEIDPAFAAAYYNAGNAAAKQGHWDEAIAYYQQALNANPRFADAQHNLGSSLYRQGKIAAALDHWRAEVRIQPAALTTLNALAWHLATYRDATVRNGAEAVDLARRAAQLCDGRDPAILDTLAAAYAEAARWTEALQTARQARDLAVTDGNSALAAKIDARVKLYQAKTPYRDPLE